MSIKEETKPKKGLLKGAVFFALSYVVLILFVFIATVIMNGKGWVQYVESNVSRLLTLCFSALMLYAIVYYYYFFEDQDFLRKGSNVIMLFTIITGSIALCFLVGVLANVYLRPTAMLSILCVFLLNRRQAILLNFIFSVLMFVIDIYSVDNAGYAYQGEQYFSFMLTFLCGTFAVFATRGVRNRFRLVLAGFSVAAPTIIVMLLLLLPSMYTVGWIQIVSSIGFSVLGCLLSSILAMALLPLYEAIFNKLTIFRLCELTSTNAPILVRLQREAPGTFNHSLIVAQLSETCAVAIGENAELARAAAYYHDVGKLKQPDCFTENQSGYNVHDELMPELSADIIRSHAKDGYDLLTTARLPSIIADVAREHHGTLPIKYFYNKAMKLSGGDADIVDYSYLGPTPQTKIAAIVMIADAAEASARALIDRSPANVEKAVRAIIEERMDLGQFNECNITLSELTTIRVTLVEALSGVHHSRIKYPAIRFTSERKAVKEENDDED